MPRSTNHQVQRRLHGRPPVRFRRRASQFVVSSHVHHRASLRGNPDLRRRPAAALDPGRLGHARAEPHPWPPPGQQESRDVLYIAGAVGSTGRSGGGEASEIEAAGWTWFLELQDTGQRGGSCNSGGRESILGAWERGSMSFGLWFGCLAASPHVFDGHGRVGYSH